MGIDDGIETVKGTIREESSLLKSKTIKTDETSKNTGSTNPKVRRSQTVLEPLVNSIDANVND